MRSMLAPRWSSKSIKVFVVRAKLLMGNSIQEPVCSLVAKTTTSRLGRSSSGREGQSIIFIVETSNILWVLETAIRILCALISGHDSKGQAEASRTAVPQTQVNWQGWYLDESM
jgi:hypothetical protein